MNIKRKKHHRLRKRKEKKLANRKMSYLDKVLKDPELRKAEWERLRRYPFCPWPQMSGYLDVANDHSQEVMYHWHEGQVDSLMFEALRMHSPLLYPPNIGLHCVNDIPHSTADDFMRSIQKNYMPLAVAKDMLGLK